MLNPAVVCLSLQASASTNWFWNLPLLHISKQSFMEIPNNPHRRFQQQTLRHTYETMQLHFCVGCTFPCRLDTLHLASCHLPQPACCGCTDPSHHSTRGRGQTEDQTLISQQLRRWFLRLVGNREEIDNRRLMFRSGGQELEKTEKPCADRWFAGCKKTSSCCRAPEIFLQVKPQQEISTTRITVIIRELA